MSGLRGGAEGARAAHGPPLLRGRLAWQGAGAGGPATSRARSLLTRPHSGQHLGHRGRRPTDGDAGWAACVAQRTEEETEAQTK